MLVHEVGLYMGGGLIFGGLIVGGLRYSYFSPGKCSCEIIETEMYTKPTENSVLAKWITPDLKCDRNAKDYTTTVSPPGYQSPMRLNRGSHKITYTYTYKNGDKLDSRKCYVNLDIGGK